MSLRLFAALAIPDSVGSQLARLQRGVPGADWRPTDNFHITLRFFGDIDERTARDLDDELGAVSVDAFAVQLAGSGWFGGAKPHALWIGVEANAALSTLAAACERAARRAGLDAESRNYTPHVTLAYCRGIDPSAAAVFAQRTNLFRAEPFHADRFFLLSSWSGKGPSQYLAEAEYPLR